MRLFEEAGSYHLPVATNLQSHSPGFGPDILGEDRT